MLVYDVILTLPREVDRIWNKMRFSGLTVIWFCNRWVYLLMVIPTIFGKPFRTSELFLIRSNLANTGLHDPAFTGKVCCQRFLEFTQAHALLLQVCSEFIIFSLQDFMNFNVF